MKKLFMVATLLFGLMIQSFSQTKPYNVVFDLTTGDTTTHQRLIRWISGIIDSHPDAKVEIVFYGKALTMVETDQSTVAGDVKRFAAGKNVVFTVCEQAMKIHHVEKSMLLPGVKTVPDAIYELVAKQAEGFGYIKVTN